MRPSIFAGLVATIVVGTFPTAAVRAQTTEFSIVDAARAALAPRLDLDVRRHADRL